jgi:SAM-dependent methyltransferase
MKIIPPSETRSQKELLFHYNLEKKLANRLRHAGQKERKQLYPELYAELFEKVPYFSIRKSDTQSRQRKVAKQLKFLSRFVSPEKTFLEIGAGDCALSLELCKSSKRVYALDVSDQIRKDVILPPNFERVTSDGFSIPLAPESVDLAFSNQLMEHLHPEDAREQLENIFKALVPGGTYVIITPHFFSGPHDISMYFDDVATGFHLKEYTLRELSGLLKQVGFSGVHAYAKTSGTYVRLPLCPSLTLERLIAPLPHNLRKRVFQVFPFRQMLRIRLAARK